MAHKHSVYDTSLHFIIDGNTRLVKNSTEAKVTLVQYDHNSERITFELPRYIDGHDMSLCTDAQVHYINIERKTNRESTGVYECDDLQIAPDDENVVICSWLISKNATRFVGSLFFVIRFVCSEDREITYSWNTARHTGLSVTDGIYNGEDVDEIVESDAFKIFNETIEAANTAIENANEATKKANDSIIHIRYSKYADGTDFVEVWTPMYDYIGIATGLTAPTDPSGYQWSRFNAKGYWTGSTEEYNAIPDDEIIDDYLYILDDDTFFEDLESGEFVVGKANTANTANTAKKAGTADNATHAETANTAKKAGTADNATHAETANNATHAKSATVLNPSTVAESDNSCSIKETGIYAVCINGGNNGVTSNPRYTSIITIDNLYNRCWGTMCIGNGFSADTEVYYYATYNAPLSEGKVIKARCTTNGKTTDATLFGVRKILDI